MASTDAESRWLPRMTAAVRQAVSWFLTRLQPTVDEAARAAAAGQPLPAWVNVPTQAEFDDELYTDVAPVAGDVFDDAFWQSIDDLATPAPPEAEGEPVLPAGNKTRPAAHDVYVQSEAEQRAFYLASVHDRLSQSAWAPDTFDEIRSTLARAVEEGWTLDETTTALRPLMDPNSTVNESWIERVAVTEMHSAYSAGQYAAALSERQLFGTPVTLQWIATHDHRTRPAHAAADRQRVPAGQPFTVGGEQLRFPGDPFASPANTIRCRCSLGIFHSTVTASTGDTTMTAYRSTHRAAVGTPDTTQPAPAPCACQQQTAAASDAPPGDSAPPGGDEPSQGDGDGSPSPWDGLHVTVTVNGTTYDVLYSATYFEFAGVDDPAQTGTITLDNAAATDDGFRFEWTEDDGSTVAEELDLADGTVETTVTGPDGTTSELSGTVALADDEPADSAEEPAADAGDADAAATAAYALRAAASLTAASLAHAPEWTPPAAHFRPYEGPKRGIQVMDGGRIAGYLATWDGEVGANCHVGIKSSCEPPPRSADGLYRYFHQAGTPLTLDDGTQVHPGLLTTDIGHGDQSKNQRARVAHYDDPRAMAAAVIAGEDDTGIWVSGSVLPEVASDPDRMTRLRLARFSGHWEPVAGRLELIAATGVNVPGYQNPSQSGYAVVASADPGDIEAAVVRRIDARTLHGDMAARGQAMRDRRARSLIAAVRAMPRQRTAARPARPHTADSSEDDGPSAGEVHLTVDDVEFIAQLLGIDPGDVEPVDLSEDDVNELLAVLDAEDETSSEDPVTAANWVSAVGGLPSLIKRVAKHLRAKGMAESHAIAAAVNTVKRWCRGGPSTKPETQAKACAAAADWERKKAQSHAT